MGGRFAKSVVFRGTKAKTVGGLTKTDLVENKRGKIVSKKSLAHGKKMYANIKAWTAEGQKGTQCEGLRCCQEGLSSLQEGQGVFQLSVSVWLQLRPWGYLRPWSAVACLIASAC